MSSNANFADQKMPLILITTIKEPVLPFGSVKVCFRPVFGVQNLDRCCAHFKSPKGMSHYSCCFHDSSGQSPVFPLWAEFISVRTQQMITELV